jgi:putative CocE/NonD family hydrolase
MQGKGSLILGLTCLVTFQVLAQRPDFTQKEVIIPMLDRVRLAADLYLPGEHTPDRYAVILIRTPYQKEGIADIAGFFVSQGFAVLVQDVSGKNKSEGKFIPFVNEKSDGIQTLKWIADQSWFNWSTGMWGSSYLGFSALTLADTGYPFLKSIFHYSGRCNL